MNDDIVTGEMFAKFFADFFKIDNRLSPDLPSRYGIHRSTMGVNPFSVPNGIRNLVNKISVTSDARLRILSNVLSLVSE